MVRFTVEQVRVEKMISLVRRFKIFSLPWLIVVQLTAFSAQAQDVPIVPCNEIVYVKATEFKDYLEFPKSPLKSIVKVTITYCSVIGSTLSDEVPYETLWYSDFKPLGCRRYRDLDILPLHKIYVYLNSSSDAARRAAVNALLRVIFDAELNRNSIAAVEVPADSFVLFVSQLEKENFYAPSKLTAFAGQGAIYVTLIDAIGDRQTVVHAGYP